MLEELGQRIWKNPKFHDEWRALEVAHLQSSLMGNAMIVDEAMLERLIRSSAVLAASADQQLRTASYRVATAATELCSEAFDGVPHFLYLVLNRLGNFPASDFAEKRYELGAEKLPVRLAGELIERRDANAVQLGEASAHLTDFQFDLWKRLNSGEHVSISAPTSAGKSFVLQSYARKSFVERKCRNIGFLVPTRALINQVSADVSVWLRDLSDVELITTPISADSELPAFGMYVLTQERMQLLKDAHPDFKLDLLIVDEFQNIGDGPRGVLLSSVIENVLIRNQNCQVLFAGPNIVKPERIGDIFGIPVTPASTREASVKQNIIFVDCDPLVANQANLSLFLEGQKTPIGAMKVDQPLHDHIGKLVNLSLSIGGQGQSLIYAMGPAECEKISIGLADDEPALVSEALEELSSLAKEAVHPEFALAETVRAGIGFHYGRIPALLRKSIEDAFSAGAIRYLVTTSTLLYGVNMPAKNLFLHSPQRGKGKPISPIDFWNLVGRAGRLGKEFEGNIFLVDYGSWDNAPMEGDREQLVRPALQQHVLDESDELANYICSPDLVPDQNKQDEYENTFVKLYRDLLSDRLPDTFERIGLQEGDARRLALLEALEWARSVCSLPLNVLNESPTVSVHRQQALFKWIEASLKKKGPEYVIPKHPMDGKAYQSLMPVFKRCHGAILGLPKADRSHSYFATIAIRWMRGDPIPKVIEESFRYKKKKGSNPNIATVIRTTLTEIEQQLRFRYVRLMSCYNSVLKHALLTNGHADIVPHIPSIPLYLEVGACKTTMISLMNVGLSRFTSVKLSEFSRRGDLTPDEARMWVRRQNIETLDLPRASIDEIKRLLVKA